MSGYSVQILGVEPAEGGELGKTEAVKITVTKNPGIRITDVSSPGRSVVIYKNGRVTPGYTVLMGESVKDDIEVFVYTVSKNGAGWGGEQLRLEIAPDLDNGNAVFISSSSAEYIRKGDSVVFTLHSKNAPCPPSAYSWEKDESAVVDEPGHIEGASLPSLTITNATLGDSGVYSCTATLPTQKLNGVIVSSSKAKESTDAFVTVVDGTLSSDKEEATYFRGENVVLSTSVVPPEIDATSFVWEKDGSVVSGSSQTRIVQSSSENDGFYTCKISTREIAEPITTNKVFVRGGTHSTLENGLVAFYNFKDGGPNDVSGNGLDMQILSGAKTNDGKVLVGWVPDDQGNLVTTETIASPTEWTMSGWCNLGTAGGTSRALFGITKVAGFSRYDNEDTGVWSKRLNDWEWKPTGAKAKKGDNIWHMYTFSYDGTTAKIYVDGVLSASKAIPSSNFTPTADVTTLDIGRAFDNNSYSFGNNSKVDEVGFWNRALSASEVLELFNKGNEGKTYPFMDISYDGRNIHLLKDCAQMFRFEENATDSISGMTFSGAGTYDVGKIDRAIVNPVLKTTNYPVLSPSQSGKASVFCWVRPVSDGAGWGGTVYGPGGSLSDGCIEICRTGKNRAGITVGRYRADSDWALENSLLWAKVTIPVNEWSFCGYTWDGSELVIWLNGEAVSSVASSSWVTAQDNSHYPYIGQTCTQGGTAFAGKIDELAYWTRSLTKDEITALYNGGDGLSFDEWTD